jgi:transposase-like protein
MELHKIHPRQTVYPNEVRYKAVLMYLIEGYSKAEIIKLTGVSYPGLNKWINNLGPALLKDNDLKIRTFELSLDTPMKKTSDNLDDQSKEIIELRKQLDRANLKVELLETMIDIAENELNIPIRKKSGPQPSKEKHKKTK